MKKIDSKWVQKSELWIPPNSKFKTKHDTDSWFDLNIFNKNKKNTGTYEINSSVIRCYPITIKPNLKQRNILLNWNDIYRQVYNLTVKYLKYNKIVSYIKLRKIIDIEIEKNDTLLGLIKKYKIPKHTRDNAVKDCITAYKAAFANLKNKNIKYFRLRYKKKLHHLSSMTIEPMTFSKKLNGFCVTVLGEMVSTIPLKNITKECRLCYNSRTGQFVIRVPYSKITEKKIKTEEIISLDPGCFPFQMGYTKNNCYEFCPKQSTEQIKEIIKKIETPNTTNPRYKKYVERLRERLRNKITDMHWKIANYLCNNFDKILIGNMSTKNIISKNKKLPKIVKKIMVGQSHYIFQQRLLSKAEEYGTIVEIVDESYTSVTCGGCGDISKTLGLSKTFNCECGFNCHRDINGARNILIKYNNQL